MTVSTNNGIVNRPAHNLIMQVFRPGSSKAEVLETWFYDIVTTQCDHPRYIKHVSDRICVFLVLLGYSVRGGGSPKELVHNLLMHFCTLGHSKMEVLEICFFDIVIT